MPDLPDLRGRVRVDTSELQSAVGRAARAGSAIGSALGTVAGGLISKGLDAGIGGLKELTLGSIEAASDLSETANKISTIFGPGAKSINDFAATADTKLGLSKQAALDAAATFGVFGKSAGLTGPKLSGFSGNLVKLSADLASFHNTTPEQAIDALGAALRGESEPLRAYGVLLDDASMRQEAVRQGLTKTTKEALTPQQKVLAAQALIMKQTAVAQGDFSKTSGGLANQQRIAAAQFENLKTKLGQGLLPVVNSVMAGFVKFMPTLQRVAESISTTVGPALSSFASMVGPVIGQIASTLGTILGPALAQVGGLVKGLFGGGGIGGAMTALQGPLAAVRAAFSAFLPVVLQLGGQIAAIVLPTLRTVAVMVVTQLIPAVVSLVAAVLPVAAAIYRALGPAVLAIIRTVAAVFKAAIQIIIGVVRLVTAVLRGDWGAAWQAVKSIVSTALGAIVGLIKNLLGSVVPAIVRGVGSLLVSLWNASLGKLVSAAGAKLSEAVGKVREFGSRIKSAISNPGAILSGIGKAIVDGLVRGIEAGWGAVQRAARALADKIPGPIKKLLGIASPSKVTTRLGEQTGEGLEVGLHNMVRPVRAAAQRVAAAATPLVGASPNQSAPVVGRDGTLSAFGARGGTGGPVDLSAASVAALAEAIAPGVVQVLLDGRMVASAVNQRVGSDAAAVIRGGGR